MKFKREDFEPDVLSLRFDHDFSIMAPNIKSEGFDLKPQLGKFGLFGDSPNFNTYYPELDPSEFAPDNEDFILPVYRLLSEVIVVKYGVPIDFSMNNVLKRSLPKMTGIAVFPDHNFDSVANSLGVVLRPYWQESYKIGNVTVPSGINGVLKIDAKSNPRIARLIQMDPPAIHSSSVTVNFKKAKSHPNMENEEFWEKLGTYDDKKNLIRLIAEEIVYYMELSLVSRGADPFAQQVKEGRIVNPMYPKSVYQFSADKNRVYIDFRKLADISLSEDTINNHKNDSDMNFTELLETLGLTATDFPDEAAFTAHFESLVQTKETLTALQAVQEDLTPESLQALVDNQIPEGSEFIPEGRELMPEGAELITEEDRTLLTQVGELGDLELVRESIADADKYLSQVRNGALAHYKLIYGDKADEKIIALIEKSTLDEALAFETQYASLLEEKIPLTCKSCGSENVSRASHKKDEKSPSERYEESNLRLAKAARRKPSSLHT